MPEMGETLWIKQTKVSEMTKHTIRNMQMFARFDVLMQYIAILPLNACMVRMCVML